MAQNSLPKYKRILLKLSGEALQGDQGYGLDPKIVERIAQEIKEVHALGVEIALVIGGGNIFRGLAASAKGMDRATADYMGMLATVLNSLAMQEALERIDVNTRLQSAIVMQELCEPYIRRKAVRHLEKGRVVIFAAGTGNPYFTTDTAATLRAMEINAQILLKATKVDGIYDKDPKIYQDAEKIHQISHLEVLTRDLKVMDRTAISLSMDNHIPILVFDMTIPGNVKRIVLGDSIGTLVQESN